MLSSSDIEFSFVMFGQLGWNFKRLDCMRQVYCQCGLLRLKRVCETFRCNSFLIPEESNTNITLYSTSLG